ncbi:hypothetical protein DOTSEDRAFT_36966 [Dothistroma septosporum NZE10]|uniref:Uncharacterized protein n=1 Tax=Dothistroma septosporum (strain NZE10 / CBS 128990) TaxID=675120 RepID=N1PJW3_DOTSN|nr:hypothetical protein DOTSEDRAFT_36966 [Dothistroma septosporum NZE10]
MLLRMGGRSQSMSCTSSLSSFIYVRVNAEFRTPPDQCNYEHANVATDHRVESFVEDIPVQMLYKIAGMLLGPIVLALEIEKGFQLILWIGFHETRTIGIDPTVEQLKMNVDDSYRPGANDRHDGTPDYLWSADHASHELQKHSPRPQCAPYGWPADLYGQRLPMCIEQHRLDIEDPHSGPFWATTRSGSAIYYYMGPPEKLKSRLALISFKDKCAPERLRHMI